MLIISWDNLFDVLPPDQLVLVTVATKLSGEPLDNDTENITLTMMDLITGSGFDSSYNLSNLLFHTDYNVSLTAVYRGVSSAAAVAEVVTTLEGGRGRGGTTGGIVPYSEILILCGPKVMSHKSQF